MKLLKIMPVQSEPRSADAAAGFAGQQKRSESRGCNANAFSVFSGVNLPCDHSSLHECNVPKAQILLCSGVIADARAKNNRMARAMPLLQMC